MTDLTKMVHHCTWANGTWIRFIDEHCRADEDLLRRMGHILLGEQAWFQRIAGEEPDRALWRVMTVPQLRAMQDAHRTTYRALLDADVTRVVTYTRFTGETYRSPISDILLHLALHGTHHRGQMSADASARGMTAVNTDFVQFCLTQGV